MNDQNRNESFKDLETRVHRFSMPRLTFRMVGFFYLFLVLVLVSTLLPSDVSAAATQISGVINNYWPGTANAAANATTITIGASRNASPTIVTGTLLLVIQMQNATINTTNGTAYGANNGSGSGSIALGNTGAYEYVTARNAIGTSGGTLQVTGKGSGNGLINSYTNSAASGTQGQWTFQVVLVPTYDQVQLNGTLTPSAWNQSTGGIVALDAHGYLDLNGQTINVSGQGFRGGGGVQMTADLTGNAGAADYRFAVSIANANNQNGAHDAKGEGIAGTPVFLAPANNTAAYLTSGTGYPSTTGGVHRDMARGAPGNAGGGGTDPDPSANDQNTGGGGGGNGGAGGLGGCAWSLGCSGTNGNDGGIGAAAFTNNATHVIMGGGGGAGTENNQDNGGIAGFTPGPSHGAPGGGIVMIRTCQISNTGTINATGATAPNTGRDGGGGGGAGGTVLVANYGSGMNGLTINTNGGNGASAWLLASGYLTDTQPSTANNRHGPGGGGGGGSILTTSAPLSTNVAGGSGGVTTNVSPSDHFGAQAGSAGPAGTITFANIPGTSFSCSPTAVTLSSFSARGAENTQDGSQAALGRVTLSWKTASEVDTAGFNLYRSERPDGPYIRINPQLVPASLDALVGDKYQYVDSNVAPGQTYYYQIEDVELNGTSTGHEPISVTVASASGRAANAPILIGLGIGALAIAGLGFTLLRKRFKLA